MKPHAATIIAALFVAEMAAIFESTMLYAALPKLIGQFGDAVTAGWLVTIHMLVGAGAALVAGRLGDILGRKSIMLIMIAIAAVGALISAASTNFGIVLTGRALQGLGSAVIPLSMGILRENMPRERLPFAIGLMTTAMGLGVAVGLVLGGAIIDNFNWHWLFVASAALLALAWLAVKIWVPTKPGTPPKERIDWIEGILPAPAVMLVLYGISQTSTLGWGSQAVWLPIIGGVVALAYWAKRSLAAREPFIDLRILADRNVALANILTIFLSLGTMQQVLIFSTYAQSPNWTMVGLGLTATMAGMAKLPSNALSLFAGPLAGLMTQKVDYRLPIVCGGLLATAGWVLALVLPQTITQLILVLCVISFGSSVLNAALPMVVVTSVPDHRTGEAVGTMSVVRGLASAIGVQIIALSLNSDTVTSPSGAAHLPSAMGFRITMAWVAGLTLLSAVIALILRPNRAATVQSKTANTSEEGVSVTI